MATPTNGSTATLIQRLRQNRRELEGWFSQTPHDLQTLVRESVKGNTFRAFHNMHAPPSVLFRSWAFAVVSQKSFIDRLRNCSSEGEFDAVMDELSGSLRAFWNYWTPTGLEMPYGPSRKLPNLLLKHLVRWAELSHARNRLLPWLHIPWDSYSLGLLRPCVVDELTIPSSAQMGWVTPEAYEKLQGCGRRIAAAAGVPAIFIDVLAWDLNH